MYKLITTSGTILGVTETVIYIKKHPTNDCYTNATEMDATGVAFNSTPYNLWGRDPMIEDAETLIVTSVDGGQEIGSLNDKNAELTDHLAEVDEIAIDLFEQTLAFETVCAEQDEAIIEIYEKIGATNNG